MLVKETHRMLLALAVLTLLVVFAAFVDFATGYRRLRFLQDIPPAPHDGLSISIVAAARNEARGIEDAVRSLLALDYPALQVTIVNDRSTDATAAILLKLASEDPRLEVVTVSELPAGWLGKNHALWVGAARSSGDLLLFTDADILFEPTTLRRAAGFFSTGTDHLTAIPDTRVPGVALNAMVAAFSVFFSMYSRPWKASDPKSRSHIGVGAFNLIRASTYRAIGTHQAIAMRPDDDLKLGKLVKKHGFRQDVVVGRHFIIVEWYASLREMVDGLMKNAFAGVDYRLAAVVGSTAALILLNVWPFIALLATGGLTRALNAVTVLLIVAIFGITARYSGTSIVYVLAYPVAALLFAYIIWRSAIIALVSGSITWRGTAYPLAAMRANRI
jgi:cellulose synthase/poly-beta-1,6-N-acetylglucosamine synthase-like glycosyltransferase